MAPNGDDVVVPGPTDLGPAILQRAASASKRVWLVSPYVTSPALAEALRACAAASKRLVTRYNGADILGSATDLHVVHALLSSGMLVRALPDGHAKVYILDDWAYVGSANLTRAGLQSGNREFGTASPI